MKRCMIITTALLLASSLGLSQYQVPGQCTELAAREGFPTDVLNKQSHAGPGTTGSAERPRPLGQAMPGRNAACPSHDE
jgi:hypothetical protein